VNIAMLYRNKECIVFAIVEKMQQIMARYLEHSPDYNFVAWRSG
jgi:hypothetical protein